MKMKNEHVFKLSEINAYFFDLPFVNDIARQGLIRLDECISILNYYPQTQNSALVYQFQNIKSVVLENEKNSDIVRNTLSKVPSIINDIRSYF
jgi:hypothetical protein